MKAIILAAGQGTRLKKYTKDLPKGMLSFMGKTIIERQIDMFRKNGITDIIIIKGFAGDKIQYDGVTYYTNEEYASTNMVESFLTAKAEFDDDVIVSYSDIVFDSSLLSGMLEANGDFVVAVDENWEAYWKARYGRTDFDIESLTIDANDNIVSLGNEQPRLDQIDARYIGLLKFSRAGLQRIISIMDRDYETYLHKPWKQSGKTIRQAYMTDLIQALIDEGCSIKAQKFVNGWLEFDTNEDYELACEWVETQFVQQFVRDIG